MFDKIKNLKITDKVALDVGTTLMAMATVVGMLELSTHSINKAILPLQPVYVANHSSSDFNNPMRREKEESGTIYVSYSESQRTPSRAGKY
ncbi:MAG TPA: hypothetical protein VIH90_04870 [Candidatus Saccharimonadales bacterium]